MVSKALKANIKVSFLNFLGDGQKMVKKDGETNVAEAGAEKAAPMETEAK